MRVKYTKVLGSPPTPDQSTFEVLREDLALFNPVLCKVQLARSVSTILRLQTRCRKFLSRQKIARILFGMKTLPKAYPHKLAQFRRTSVAVCLLDCVVAPINGIERDAIYQTALSAVDARSIPDLTLN